MEHGAGRRSKIVPSNNSGEQSDPNVRCTLVHVGPTMRGALTLMQTTIIALQALSQKMGDKTGAQIRTQVKTLSVNLHAQGKVQQQERMGAVMSGMILGSCMKVHVSPFEL